MLLYHCGSELIKFQGRFFFNLIHELKGVFTNRYLLKVPLEHDLIRSVLSVVAMAFIIIQQPGVMTLEKLYTSYNRKYIYVSILNE